MVVSIRWKPAPPALATSGTSGRISPAKLLGATASSTRPALRSIIALAAAVNRAAERSRPPFSILRFSLDVASGLADLFQSLASGLVLPLLGDVTQRDDADQPL